MKKILNRELLKEKVPLTNIKINRDFTRYEISVKSFFPDNNTAEIFKEVFESSDLLKSEIDEIRKIYFLYFKKHMDLISKHIFIKVDIPTLGCINVNVEELCKLIEKFSKGFVFSNMKKSEIPDFYNTLIILLKKIVKHNNKFYSDDFVKNKNKEWKRNFYNRNIKFKEVIIDDGLFF